MRSTYLITICALSLTANAKTVRVAVIDTGLGMDLLSTKMVCPTGSHNFVNGTDVPADSHGHGTHISGLIDQYAKNIIIKRSDADNDKKLLLKTKANYCQVILKYYDPESAGTTNLANTIAAFKWATKLGVDYINYSGGGAEYSQEEYLAVEDALNHGIHIIAAGGNERDDADVNHYYPAYYDKRIVVVGNIDQYGKRNSSSNWGKRFVWEVGVGVLSTLPSYGMGYLSGTSQSAAIRTGKMVYEQLTR